MLIAGIALLSALLCGFLALMFVEYGVKETLKGLAISAVITGLTAVGMAMVVTGLAN